MRTTIIPCLHPRLCPWLLASPSTRRALESTFAEMSGWGTLPSRFTQWTCGWAFIWTIGSPYLKQIQTGNSSHSATAPHYLPSASNSTLFCQLYYHSVSWEDFWDSDFLFFFFNVVFIYFLTSLLENNCFTMVSYFLLYNTVNQLYIYIYLPISPPSCVSLPPSLSHPSRWSQSTALISLCYVAASH